MKKGRIASWRIELQRREEKRREEGGGGRGRRSLRNYVSCRTLEEREEESRMVWRVQSVCPYTYCAWLVVGVMVWRGPCAVS